MERLEPVFCGLLPHPPIVVPEVGGERTGECIQTTRACREFARRLTAARPGALLLVSPHSPRRPGAFGIWDGDRLRGDLAAFRAPRARLELPADSALRERIERAARKRGIPTWRIPAGPLDHGAVVPLWFLVEAGWRGPTAVVSLPMPGSGDLSAFGEALAEALQEGQGPHRSALVASGDMSHRALPGAPAGFHPRACDFDRTVVELVREGRLPDLQELDPELRELAAEDVVESSLVAGAALGFRVQGPEVLSYEHPFGVGYLVAVFFAEQPGPDPFPHAEAAGLEILPAVAREAVRARLEGGPPALPPAGGGLRRPAPVFVTLRNPDGSLRGCIGCLEARKPDLVAETADRAAAAAFDDPRFPPLAREELAGVAFSVSVLGPLQPVEDRSELDPSRFGVVVSASGGRRGVLLPDVEGVDSVEAQVTIALSKACIRPEEPFEVERFEVRKAEEAP
ncbi:MAG: AmmeMemoRadiSam system protein A [Planctomycetota bacterium]